MLNTHDLGLLLSTDRGKEQLQVLYWDEKLIGWKEYKLLGSNLKQIKEQYYDYRYQFFYHTKHSSIYARRTILEKFNNYFSFTPSQYIVNAPLENAIFFYMLRATFMMAFFLIFFIFFLIVQRLIFWFTNRGSCRFD